MDSELNKDKKEDDAKSIFDLNNISPELLARALQLASLEQNIGRAVEKAEFSSELNFLNGIRTRSYWQQDRLLATSLSKLLSNTDFDLSKDFQAFVRHFKLIAENLNVLSFIESSEDYPPITPQDVAVIIQEQDLDPVDVLLYDADVPYFDPGVPGVTDMDTVSVAASLSSKPQLNEVTRRRIVTRQDMDGYESAKKSLYNFLHLIVENSEELRSIANRTGSCDKRDPFLHY